MKITINRQAMDLPASDLTIQDVLRVRNVRLESVAVALNGEVVPRELWTSRVVRAADDLEIVQAVAGGEHTADDRLVIAGQTFGSRLFLGTGKYADDGTMLAALDASGTEMVTVAIRYMALDGNEQGTAILDKLDLQRYRLLPNTAGAQTVDDAVRMARLARAATGTNWIKLEVIGDTETLWPDVTATAAATKILADEGFIVLPYTSPDLVAAKRLEQAGAATVMPLASPIGSGQGMRDWASIARIVAAVSVPVVVDAGIGVPSDAAIALELGAAAVLVNTAIAKATNPARMAAAMRHGVVAGRLSFLAGRMPMQERAVASSPTAGVPVAPV